VVALVVPPETVAELAREVDRIVCLSEPSRFQALGYHYREFPQLSDEEVVGMLRELRLNDKSWGCPTAASLLRGQPRQVTCFVCGAMPTFLHFSTTVAFDTNRLCTAFPRRRVAVVCKRKYVNRR
jgi:hypothetical protein